MKRICSYCGSDACHDNEQESKGHWFALVSGGNNNRCLYFLCNDCYAKQNNMNRNQSETGIDVKQQKTESLDLKEKLSIRIRSKLKTYFIQRLS